MENRIEFPGESYGILKITGSLSTIKGNLFFLVKTVSIFIVVLQRRTKASSGNYCFIFSRWQV